MKHPYVKFILVLSAICCFIASIVFLTQVGKNLLSLVYSTIFILEGCFVIGILNIVLDIEDHLFGSHEDTPHEDTKNDMEG